MSTAIQQFRGDNNLLAQAEMLAKANIVPKAFRGKPADVLAAILWGDELGLGPMAAMNFIDIIDGNPTLNTEGRVALVRRAGHSIQITATATEATAHGKRRDTGDEQTVTWTIEMARRAGLANKQVWKAYPEAMLTSRAVSQLTRNLFPDVTGGFSYAAEEVASFAAPELMDQPEVLVRAAGGSTSNAEPGRLATSATPAALNPVATPATADGAAGDRSPSPAAPVEVTTTSPKTFAPPQTKSEFRQAQENVAKVNAKHTTEKKVVGDGVSAEQMAALRRDLAAVTDQALRDGLRDDFQKAGLPNIKHEAVVLDDDEYAVALDLILAAVEKQAEQDALEAPFDDEPTLNLEGGDAA